MNLCESVFTQSQRVHSHQMVEVFRACGTASNGETCGVERRYEAGEATVIQRFVVVQTTMADTYAALCTERQAWDSKVEEYRQLNETKVDVVMRIDGETVAAFLERKVKPCTRSIVVHDTARPPPSTDPSPPWIAVDLVTTVRWLGDGRVGVELRLRFPRRRRSWLPVALRRNRACKRVVRLADLCQTYVNGATGTEAPAPAPNQEHGEEEPSEDAASTLLREWDEESQPSYGVCCWSCMNWIL